MDKCGALHHKPTNYLVLYPSEVDMYLEKGWELYGSPFYANTTAVQAVTFTPENYANES